jgi:hypothetical protein
MTFQRRRRWNGELDLSPSRTNNADYTDPARTQILESSSQREFEGGGAWFDDESQSTESAVA